VSPAFVCGTTHWPTLQDAGGAHESEVVQPAKQSPVDWLQRYGAQGFAGSVVSAGCDANPSDVQVGEVDFGVQVWLDCVQVNPVAQSVSAAHVVLHEVAPHAYGEHVVGEGTLHPPAPSHEPAAVPSPAAQLASEQLVSGPCAKPTHFERSFAPSHARALQVSLPPSEHAIREPWGGPLMALQTPSAPETSHASHCPAHAESQQ
jgi:hypothetical protein